jgi:hypothetical protein
MMAKITVMSCLMAMLLLGSAHCQEVGDDLAVIHDTDGYVNVRANPSSSSSIIGKVFTGDIIYFSPENIKNGWYPVNYQINTEKEDDSKEIIGYIHKTRVTPLSKFKKVVFKNKKIDAETLNLSDDRISLVISTGNFDSTKHAISQDKSGQYLINGVRAWGTEGQLPLYEITSINLSENGDKIEIPFKEYWNLYEPNFERINVYIEKNRIYVHMQNSDGAAVYDAIFVIKNKKYQRKYVYQNPYD